MKLKNKKITALTLLLSLFCFNCSAINFDLVIKDTSGTVIRLAPVVETKHFSLEGDVIIAQKQAEERTAPTLKIREVEDQTEGVIIQKNETRDVTIELGDIDFSSMGLSKGDSIFHRLMLQKVEDGSVIGYLSFRCSVFNTNPGITLESNTGYKISEESLPFGGGGSIRIVVKKE